MRQEQKHSWWNESAHQVVEVDQYFAYARISGSKEQRQKNLSIPSQIDQIENYVKHHPEIKISKIYTEIHSAYKGKRPVFHKMLLELRRNPTIKGIIVMKRDRVSRNPDDYMKIQKIRWEDNPVEVVSVTEPMISSYLGRYFVRDLQNRAILYSEELSFRVKLGQRKKMQMGWYVYAAPYGYKTVNGYLIEDNDGNKAEIVKYIFQMYSTGQIGYRELAKKVVQKFNPKNFYWKRVDFIIRSSIYYGVCTKVRNLNSQEYVFFGAEKPGKFTEQYPIKHIAPLITKELYDQCQEVRQRNNPYARRSGGVAKFPKIYQCSCGRRLRRLDKPTRRYLFCGKEINGAHPHRCKERHTPLLDLDKDIESIIRRVIPPKNIREEMTQYVKDKIDTAGSDKNKQLSENLQEIRQLQKKLQELTSNYTTGAISNEVFVLSSEQINDNIRSLKGEISALEDFSSFSRAWHKVIRFIEILWIYEQKLDSLTGWEKRSRVYSAFFKQALTCVVWSRKISSYVLKQPFEFFNVPVFWRNWAWLDLNQRPIGYEPIALTSWATDP